MFVFDHSNARSVLGDPGALVERGRQVLEIDHPVAIVLGQQIWWYASQEDLDADLADPGSCDFSGAALAVNVSIVNDELVFAEQE